MKLTEILKDLKNIFGGTQEVFWVLEKITGKSEADLVAHENLELTKEQQAKLNLFIEKTKQHYPLQYLLESVPFLDLNILVEPPVLIPRPETEEWVGDLIDSLKDFKKHEFKILDLCSGSGCIALALAKNFPNSDIYGIDISQYCIDLANKNKKLNKLNNIEFILSDLYKNLDFKFKFDLIVANPPYISESDFNTLQPEVKLWEDKKALIATNNGLEVIEKIINSSKKYLKDKNNSELSKNNINQIYIEIDYNQAEKVKKLFQNNNFSNITIIKDLNNKNRVVSAGV